MSIQLQIDVAFDFKRVSVKDEEPGKYDNEVSSPSSINNVRKGDQPGLVRLVIYISIESGSGSCECEWRDIPDAARYPFYLSQQRYEDRADWTAPWTRACEGGGEERAATRTPEFANIERGRNARGREKEKEGVERIRR